MVQKFCPEGVLIETAANQAAMRSVATLQEAMRKGTILEARTLICDAAHNLIVDLGCCRGYIPRKETVVGIEDGSTRDIAIISRVNKPVCFLITGFEKDAAGNITAILSRRKAQEACREEYIAPLQPGCIIDARVTHLEPFGAFVDIGCGNTSLMPIDAISVSRIAHPKDRFTVGQDIRAVIKSFDLDGRITLTHKELLGTWSENAAAFSTGETVAGIVRSVESYGVFVELTPNLAGLAEPREGVRAGQHASVYVKSLIPSKMKIKLIIVDCFDAAYLPPKPVYYIDSSYISRWQYSPESAERKIESCFLPR